MDKKLSGSQVEPELLARTEAKDVKADAPKTQADRLKADLEAQRAKAAAMAAKPAPTPRVYVVVAGDSLSAIAKKVYGDANRWQEILEANKATVKNPNAIRVGQELVIP